MAGNQGDQGDQGDQGGLDIVGTSAGGVRFADRVDLPFITEKDPISGQPIDVQRTGRTSFGNNWDAGWFAWRAVADFGLTDWRDSKTGINLLPWSNFQGGKTTDEEIKDLECMALNERPDALAEIVSQREEFISYFMAVCGGNRSTHPATFRVYCIATLVSSVVTMHFKGHYDRPRPAFIAPALMPPLPFPGHASYPSGHSTQAYLFALCAIEMLPAAQKPSLRIVVNALAARIARNREIAGLHYASDTMAGAWLGEEIFKKLNDTTKMSIFTKAIAKAQVEWIDQRFV
jgi:hypothetical protein